MRFLNSSLFIICLFASNLLLATNDPLTKIKESSENLLDILYSNSEDIEGNSFSYINNEFNLDIIIRRTLGRNWNKINPKDKDRIVFLIKKLVLRAFVDGMQGQAKPIIKYSDTKYISSKRAEIMSKIYFTDKSISLNYRLGLISNKWEIFDIVIENISIVLTFRNQFDAFFTNHSSADLIKKLEKLLTNENLGQSFPF